MGRESFGEYRRYALTSAFRGWEAVAKNLFRRSKKPDAGQWSLNEGQRDSLRAIAKRLPSNGVLIADEVGMGKTRIAVALTRSVIEEGGRVAILIPPGLGYQWRQELRDGGVDGGTFLRSMWTFFDAWQPGAERKVADPWFKREVVLVSHGLTNWRMGEGSLTWRWALLPLLYAHFRNSSEIRESVRIDCEDAGKLHILTTAKDIVKYIRQTPKTPVLSALRCRIKEILSKIDTDELLDPASYGRGMGMRWRLEQALGLGLGSFDLILTDEAHKSRGDDSGLSRLLNDVIVHNPSARRVSMTATPVELHPEQWRQALNRIGVTEGEFARPAGEDIFQSYANACERVRDCPGNVEIQVSYREVAQRFQEILSPYLLRRDKRDLECTKNFAKHSGKPALAYRSFENVEVETQILELPWKRAVCAAEALSIATRQADDGVAKRLRLTMGNGHGIATLIDQVKRDSAQDSLQEQEDGNVASLAEDSNLKRHHRANWWKQVLGHAFLGDDPTLYDHPAILAAVNKIEGISANEGKVLVFGRFTRPMQALVQLLNARAMLKALDQNVSWPQAKVHEAEWTAVQAASRQLGYVTADRTLLDARLSSQYATRENERRQRRDSLTETLRSGLSGTRFDAVFKAFTKAEQNHVEHQGIAPRVLLDRALEATSGDIGPGPMVKAFEKLIDTILHQEDEQNSSEREIDEYTADCWWNTVHLHLTEEYGNSEGSFARLMYGGTSQQTRRLLQLAFNRPDSHPKVLVAQSVVGREGLNLHQACRHVLLLHPEWNPGVVEQQIGRVDRVGSQWEKDLATAMEKAEQGLGHFEMPNIMIHPIIFRGTYDEVNWETLYRRWDELRATLHGVVISDECAKRMELKGELVEYINSCAPNFRP